MDIIRKNYLLFLGKRLISRRKSASFEKRHYLGNYSNVHVLYTKRYTNGDPPQLENKASKTRK